MDGKLLGSLTGGREGLADLLLYIEREYIYCKLAGMCLCVCFCGGGSGRRELD